MKSEEKIRVEIKRVRQIKSQAFARGDWQLGNELNSWIGALEWVLKDNEDEKKETK